MVVDSRVSCGQGSAYVVEPIDIKDGSLRVRMLQQGDLQKMVEWLTDERVLEFYEGRDTTWTEASVQEHFYVAPDHEAEYLRVIIELDGKSIGYGQIYRLYGELFDEYQWPSTGEVVYAMDQFIGEPELWDVGIGTKYVRMATEHIVKTRGASAVLMDPRKENPRAVRCYQKAGYEIVGELSAHELHEGKYDDCYLMAYRAPVLS